VDAKVSTKPSLTLKRHIKSSPAQVFAAWTNPAKIADWFGPEGAYEVNANIDPRVGGRFHITFRTPDGELQDCSGVYREVVPNAKLVFTWSWRSTPERESLVTVALKPDASGTMITFTHAQLFNEEVRDNHREGWTGAFDKLEVLYA
jgi:uncharacterized protein YndB with AHSA1/START domain